MNIFSIQLFSFQGLVQKFSEHVYCLDLATKKPFDNIKHAVRIKLMHSHYFDILV